MTTQNIVSMEQVLDYSLRTEFLGPTLANSSTRTELVRVLRTLLAVDAWTNEDLSISTGIHFKASGADEILLVVSPTLGGYYASRTILENLVTYSEELDMKDALTGAIVETVEVVVAPAAPAVFDLSEEDDSDEVNELLEILGIGSSDETDSAEDETEEGIPYVTRYANLKQRLASFFALPMSDADRRSLADFLERWVNGEYGRYWLNGYSFGGYEEDFEVRLWDEQTLLTAGGHLALSLREDLLAGLSETVPAEATATAADEDDPEVLIVDDLVPRLAEFLAVERPEAEWIGLAEFLDHWVEGETDGYHQVGIYSFGGNEEDFEVLVGGVPAYTCVARAARVLREHLLAMLATRSTAPAPIEGHRAPSSTEWVEASEGGLSSDAVRAALVEVADPAGEVFAAPKRPEGIPVALLFLDRLGDLASIKDMMAIQGRPATPDPDPDRFRAWQQAPAALTDEDFWAAMRTLRNRDILDLTPVAYSLRHNNVSNHTALDEPVHTMLEALREHGRLTRQEAQADTHQMLEIFGSR